MKFQVRERSLWLMVALAVVVGAGSGVLASALRSGVHWVFQALASLREGSFGLFIPAIGALLGVWVVRLLFREPGGHGVSAVLDAVSRRGGAMRKRSMISRLLGSLMTVAGGGSAGLEGPIVFSSAALGSSAGGALRLGERQRILLLACGVAGGIGAIFNAPLTGMIFATEVVLAEWTITTVIPVAVSAVMATEIGRALLGSAGAFQAGEFEWHTADLLASAPLGLFAGLVSVALVAGIFRFERFARKARNWPPFTKVGLFAGATGILVGGLGLLRPESIGEGYETVSSMLGGDLVPGVGILLAILAAKMLATVFTLGSNAPGGIFAPSLVLGAVLGASFGSLLGIAFPEVGFADPGFFALVAMAGLVAGAMQAPFTGIFLALETTAAWDHVLPLMLVATISALVFRTFLPHSFYSWELAESGQLLRPGTDRRILADVSVGEMLDAESVFLPAGRTLEDLVHRLATTRRNHFAVVDTENKLLGMLDLAALRPYLLDETLRRMTSVDTVMDASSARLHVGDSLLEAMECFESASAWVLPVVDAKGIFLGTVSKSNLFDRYRSELMVQTAERAE